MAGDQPTSTFSSALEAQLKELQARMLAEHGAAVEGAVALRVKELELQNRSLREQLKQLKARCSKMSADPLEVQNRSLREQIKQLKAAALAGRPADGADGFCRAVSGSTGVEDRDSEVDSFKDPEESKEDDEEGAQKDAEPPRSKDGTPPEPPEATCAAGGGTGPQRARSLDESPNRSDNSWRNRRGKASLQGTDDAPDCTDAPARRSSVAEVQRSGGKSAERGRQSDEAAPRPEGSSADVVRPTRSAPLRRSSSLEPARRTTAESYWSIGEAESGKHLYMGRSRFSNMSGMQSWVSGIVNNQGSSSFLQW